MEGTSDRELLCRYAGGADQDAFSQLVGRHGGWLYSAARRQLEDGHLAEDVTQAVFLLLARRAKGLRRHTYVSGWLFRAMGYCVRRAVRDRARLEKREREAATMRPEMMEPGANWDEIAPNLEHAVASLPGRDRDAVLLRFYEQKPLAEVGRLLGVSEDAARMRVDRAVEKLRGLLERQGVTGTSAGLSVVLVGNVVQEVPARVVEGVMSALCGGGGSEVAGGIAKKAAKMMAWAKVKMAVLGVGIGVSLALAGAAVYAQSRGEVPGQTSAQQVAAKQEEANPPGQRLLSFPQGVTLGMLYVRDDGPYDYALMDWKYLAPATGQVRVPAGKQIELRVSGGAIAQLAVGLKALPADSIHRVSLDNTAADDAIVAGVLPLKGLKSLSLGQTRLTDHVAATLGQLTQLEDLALTNTAAGPECLAAIKSLRNLRSLELLGTKITDASLQHLAGMSELQVLDLGRNQIHDEGVILLGDLPKLRWLRLGHGMIHGGPDQAGLTDRATEHIAKWTNLETLDLQNTAVTDHGVAALSKLPRLKELRIFYTLVTDAGMADIATISTLEKLQLPDGITEAGLALLGDHPSLKQIENMRGLDDQALAVLAHLPALEAIELSGPRITDAGMQWVGKMRSLRRLTLSECAVGDDGFAKLASLQLLEQLSLGGTRITPEGLAPLKGFRHLTLLSLGDNALVRGGLKDAAGLEALKTLCLQGNGLALDDAVLADVGQLTGLQELVVQNWDARASISDAGVSHLAKLVKLQQLLLDTPGTLTDRSLVLLSGLHELGFLRLHGRFTDDGLRALEEMPVLRSICLPGRFSEQAIARLRERTPSLQGVIILDK